MSTDISSAQPRDASNAVELKYFSTRHFRLQGGQVLPELMLLTKATAPSPQRDSGRLRRHFQSAGGQPQLGRRSRLVGRTNPARQAIDTNKNFVVS
jgi:hypothetical protein